MPIITEQLQEATKRYEELSKEQESLIDIFSEERQRRDQVEEDLRKKMKVYTSTISCSLFVGFAFIGLTHLMCHCPSGSIEYHSTVVGQVANSGEKRP